MARARARGTTRGTRARGRMRMTAGRHTLRHPTTGRFVPAGSRSSHSTGTTSTRAQARG